MGKGGQNVTPTAGTSSREPKPEVTWTDVHNHKEKTDQWLVIDGEVYDVTRWARKHPGGSRVVNHYAGQDATVSK